MKSGRIELKAGGDIQLRQFTAGDADAIFALIDRNREHLSQHGDVTAMKYPTKESVMESIEHPINPAKLRFGIWIADAFVGSVNLTPDMRLSAEIGCYLGKEFTGRGYMTRSISRTVRYGFEDMGLREIYAKIQRNNHPSVKLIGRAGFLPDESRSNATELYYFCLKDNPA
ncbi:MAG: GNAT family N-acetyltransferase [Candidatus Aenigmarchaeota archaeon]|nr:GNAT family N-acetyltransferase [Candidatus Aenigmarchaeota archaeon]